MTHRARSLGTAAVFGAIAVLLLGFPAPIWWLFALEGGGEAALMGRRAAMLFAGLTVLCFLLRDAGPTPERRGAAAAISVAMGGLAVLGLAEWLRGAIGPGVLVAVAVEISLVALWAREPE